MGTKVVYGAWKKNKKSTGEEMKIRMKLINLQGNKALVNSDHISIEVWKGLAEFDGLDERQCSNITTIAREEQERFFNSSISQRIDDLEKLNEQRFQEK